MSQNPTLIIKGSNYPLQVYHHIKAGWERLTVVRVTFDGSLTSRQMAIYATPGKGQVVLHAKNINYDAALSLLMSQIQTALADGRLSYRDDDVAKEFSVK